MFGFADAGKTLDKILSDQQAKFETLEHTISDLQAQLTQRPTHAELTESLQPINHRLDTLEERILLLEQGCSIPEYTTPVKAIAVILQRLDETFTLAQAAAPQSRVDQRIIDTTSELHELVNSLQKNKAEHTFVTEVIETITDLSHELHAIEARVATKIDKVCICCYILHMRFPTLP